MCRLWWSWLCLYSAKREVYERTGKDSSLVAHSQGGSPDWTAGHR